VNFEVLGWRSIDIWEVGEDCVGTESVNVIVAIFYVSCESK